MSKQHIYDAVKQTTKGTDLSVHSRIKLNALARQLNERLHKKLEFGRPTQQFNACVTSTELRPPPIAAYTKTFLLPFLKSKHSYFHSHTRQVIILFPSALTL